MKKKELVYLKILNDFVEKGKDSFTQLGLSKELKLSLSVVNSAVKKLNEIGAVKILDRCFKIIDLKKALYFLASIRNLSKDIIFQTRVETSVRELERIMPSGVTFTGYSGFKFKYNDVPADYSEVYVYADETELDEIQKRIKTNFKTKNQNPNLFVLKKDSLFEKNKKISDIRLFIDLWNLKEWYASDFVNEIENKLFKNIL
jgi:hypothetical protein